MFFLDGLRNFECYFRHVEDARGQLVWRYIKIISTIQPKAFVFENVTGLLSAKNSNGEKILSLLQAAFKDIGYTISTKVVNAADYGIPQKRKRVLIVGLKNNKEFEFPVPTHNEKGIDGLKKYVSVQEALGDLPQAIEDENSILNYKTAPVSDYQWTGTTDLGAYFVSTCSSHYEWAIKKIKAHCKKTR